MQLDLFETSRALNVIARVHHVRITSETRKRVTRQPVRDVKNRVTSDAQYEWEPWDRIEVMLQVLTPSRSAKELGCPHMYGQITQGAVVRAGVYHPFRDLKPGQCYSWSVIPHEQVKEDR